MAKRFAGWVALREPSACITFSWEFETRNTNKVFKFYRPKSVTAVRWKTLSYQEQIAYDSYLRGKRFDQKVRDVLTKVGASADAGVDHGSGAAPLPTRNFEYYELIGGIDTGATLPQVPHQEVSDDNCELCHPTYVDDFEVLKTELDWIKDTFSAAGRSDNFHIHVSFPVVPGSCANRDTIHKQLVGLTLLVSNKGFFSTLNNDIKSALQPYASVLSKGTANNIESFLKNPQEIDMRKNLGTFVDADHAVCGPAKFTRVGFRYIPYHDTKNQITDGVYTGQVERVGLEFRSGYDLAAFKELLEKVIVVLEGMGKDAPTEVQRQRLARCMNTYTAALGLDLQMSSSVGFDLQAYLDYLASKMGAVVPEKRLPWTAQAADKPQAIVAQLSYPFIKWEDHPLIPNSDRVRIRSARETTVAQVKKIWNDAHHAPPSPDLEKDQINKVWAAMRTWNATVDIKQYFTLDAALAG